MTIEQDLARFKKAESRKSRWVELYEDAMTYIAPNREIFFSSEHEQGQDKNETDRLFDSTAQNAHAGFVSNLQSGLVPPMKKWVRLRAGAGIQDPGDVNNQLEEVTDLMFRFIHMSNFDTQSAVALSDLAFGIGALQVHKGTKENPLRFEAIHLAQLFVEEGPHGRIDTVFRKFSVPARNIDKTWDDAKISSELAEIIDENPDERICLIEGTIPEEITVIDRQTKKKTKKMGYRYFVIDEKNSKYIVQRTQRSTPWVIFRWPTIPGEVYSRGPAIKALPDIKTLNKTKELILMAASVNILPPMLVDSNSTLNLDNLKLGQLAFIPVDNVGGPGGSSIQPMLTGSDINVAQLVINDLQQSIQKAMFSEPLGRIDLPVKSATEVALRQQELAQRTGAAFGRLQFEFIAPLIKRILFILGEEFDYLTTGDGASLDELLNGVDANLEVISPLAQAQDQEDLTSALRYVETMVGTLGPQLGLMAVKPKEFAMFVAEKLKVSPQIVPTAQEFEADQQAAQQLMAQQIEQGQVPGQ